MDLLLFAQQNNAAFQGGMVIGIILAVIVCASIPISVGANKGQPLIGVIGGICAGGTAALFGCLGGLPVAGVFVVIIFVMSNAGSGGGRKRRRSEYDDYDDDEDYDRPKRRKKRRTEDEDDDDDRPRRWD